MSLIERFKPSFNEHITKLLNRPARSRKTQNSLFTYQYHGFSAADQSPTANLGHGDLVAAYAASVTLSNTLNAHLDRLLFSQKSNNLRLLRFVLLSSSYAICFLCLHSRSHERALHCITLASDIWMVAFNYMEDGCKLVSSRKAAFVES